MRDRVRPFYGFPFPDGLVGGLVVSENAAGTAGSQGNVDLRQPFGEVSDDRGEFRFAGAAIGTVSATESFRDYLFVRAATTKSTAYVDVTPDNLLALLLQHAWWWCRHAWTRGTVGPPPQAAAQPRHRMERHRQHRQVAFHSIAIKHAP